MKRITNFQIVIGFLVIIISFLQAYNHWERELLSYFFLAGGLGILVFNLIAIYKNSKSKDKHFI
jgi:hypothetical protein